MASSKFASTAAGPSSFPNGHPPTPAPSTIMYNPNPQPQLQPVPNSQGYGGPMNGLPYQNGSSSGYPHGNGNGYDSGYAQSDLSTSSDRQVGNTDHPLPDHAIKIVSHAQSVGFQAGLYSDIELIIRDRPYRLHRLILSRSPFWAAHLFELPPGVKVVIQLFDEAITDEAIAIALGHLYSSHMNDLVTSENSKACLAAAQLFGLPDLASLAYEVSKRSINYDSIGQWIEWCGVGGESSVASTSTSAPPSPSQHQQGGPQGQAGALQALVSMYTPQSQMADAQAYGSIINGSGGGGGGPRPFSPAPSDHRGLSGGAINRPVYATSEDVTGTDWKARLRGDVHTYITQILPLELESNPASSGTPPTPLSQDTRYIDIFTLLPFDLFRACIEDPKLKVGGDSQQARFSFAKNVIAKRKKRAAQILAANPGLTPAPVENVVLQIGGNGHQVHITRKSRPRTLWKVDKE